MTLRIVPFATLLLALASLASSCAERQTSSRPMEVSYAQVHSMLEEYCVRCHSGDAPKAELDMTEYASLMKGGKSGRVVFPGDASASRIVELVEEGKMPVGKKSPRPSRDEILALRAWIDAGAQEN